MDRDLLITAVILGGGLYAWRTQARFDAPEAITQKDNMESGLQSGASQHNGQQLTTDEPHINEEDAKISALKILIQSAETSGTTEKFTAPLFPGTKLPLGLH